MTHISEMTREEMITELINLEAILNLPKGTEHFVSDIHGEYFAFQHILRNGSGGVRAKLHDYFEGKLTQADISQLSTLIIYPEEKLAVIQQEMESKQAWDDWESITIYRLIEFLEFVASKYTRSKVRKALPTQFSYIIEELLYRNPISGDKQEYYLAIVKHLINLDQADDLIIGLSYTIQRLIVDHLHVVGDIYDRGPAPDKIMEAIMNYHSVDIQWGNHDIIWMGASCGSWACMANVIRICARYNNLSIIEDCYGINLRPLFMYADKYYQQDERFNPKLMEGEQLEETEIAQVSKIQQAISILQFKLEAEIIRRRPEFHLKHRLLLDSIDYEDLSIQIEGKKYPLEHFNPVMINPKNPSELFPEELQLLEKLSASFQNSEKLHRHMDFLFNKGHMYQVYNGNLLFHGCMPLNDHMEFASLSLEGKSYKGRALLDQFEHYVRMCAEHTGEEGLYARDVIWYLWTGKHSSLFGKNEMKTFERYYIGDKKTHHEVKNEYFSAREHVEMIDQILQEFGLSIESGHIINGHTPVKEREGECPIKANGKMIVIDGGFSRPYHKTTGINGYTLLYNSYGMQLVTHEHFENKEKAIMEELDVLSTNRVVDQVLQRKRVKDTTIGQMIALQIQELQERLGITNEK